MPAPLVPDEASPGLATQIDSAEMFEALRRVQRAGSIMNGPDVDPVVAGFLQRLSNLTLVEAGYTAEQPYVWTITHNGERVVRYLEAEVAHRAEAAAEEDERQRAKRITWLP